MSALQLSTRYLTALHAQDLDAMLAVFEPQALVVSPMCGTVDVETYYCKVFAHTSRSIIKLIHVFEAARPGTSIALHFHCTWVPTIGKKVDFECVKVFELKSAATKFTRLTIIYDPGPVRQRWKEAEQTARQASASIADQDLSDDALASMGL